MDSEIMVDLGTPWTVKLTPKLNLAREKIRLENVTLMDLKIENVTLMDLKQKNIQHLKT